MRKGVSNYSLSKGYLVIQDTIKLELCAHVQSSFVRCDIFLLNMSEDCFIRNQITYRIFKSTVN